MQGASENALKQRIKILEGQLAMTYVSPSPGSYIVRNMMARMHEIHVHTNTFTGNLCFKVVEIAQADMH